MSLRKRRHSFNLNTAADDSRQTTGRNAPASVLASSPPRTSHTCQTHARTIHVPIHHRTRASSPRNHHPKSSSTSRSSLSGRRRAPKRPTRERGSRPRQHRRADDDGHRIRRRAPVTIGEAFLVAAAAAAAVAAAVAAATAAVAAAPVPTIVAPAVVKRAARDGARARSRSRGRGDDDSGDLCDACVHVACVRARVTS